MSLGQTVEFLRGFHKQAKHTCNDGFEMESNPRALQQARSQFHKDMVSCLDLDETDFLFSFK